MKNYSFYDGFKAAPKYTILILWIKSPRGIPHLLNQHVPADNYITSLARNYTHSKIPKSKIENLKEFPKFLINKRRQDYDKS